MSSFIAIIGKDSTENLDIYIESLCFGVTTKGNTANSHAKEAQVGDKLYFWVSGSGYDGYAQISELKKCLLIQRFPIGLLLNRLKKYQIHGLTCCISRNMKNCQIENTSALQMEFENYWCKTSLAPSKLNSTT